MLTFENFAPLSVPWRGAVVTIGNFDGVHRGHAELVARARAHADALGVPALALTFDPHPTALLRPNANGATVPLLELDQRVQRLRAAGVDQVGVFRTGPWLLELTAREFYDRVLVGQLGALGVVEGADFAFGRDRQGNAAQLAAWCAADGRVFEEVAPITDPLTGLTISSSRIRAALQSGDIPQATRMLGRRYDLRGLVVLGEQRGRELGFPTANLDLIATLIPADGVYAARASIHQHPPHARALRSAQDAATPTSPYLVACHIGPNVVFGARQRTVEAHFLDFQGDLYGKWVDLEFVGLVRPSRNFAGVAELVDQIRLDVECVRNLIREEAGNSAL